MTPEIIIKTVEVVTRVLNQPMGWPEAVCTAVCISAGAAAFAYCFYVFNR